MSSPVMSSPATKPILEKQPVQQTITTITRYKCCSILQPKNTSCYVCGKKVVEIATIRN